MRTYRGINEQVPVWRQYAPGHVPSTSYHSQTKTHLSFPEQRLKGNLLFNSDIISVSCFSYTQHTRTMQHIQLRTQQLPSVRSDGITEAICLPLTPSGRLTQSFTKQH